MMPPVRRLDNAKRVLLTFGFFVLLAFGVLIFEYVVGSVLVLVLVIPALVLLIYLLPGHGEAPPSGDARFCWRCGHRTENVGGTPSWRCTACGNVQELGP